MPVNIAFCDIHNLLSASEKKAMEEDMRKILNHYKTDKCNKCGGKINLIEFKDKDQINYWIKYGECLKCQEKRLKYYRERIS